MKSSKLSHHLVWVILYGCGYCRCVHCKGLPYPPTYPRPIVTSLPVHLPLCNPTSDRTSYEVHIIIWLHEEHLCFGFYCTIQFFGKSMLAHQVAQFCLTKTNIFRILLKIIFQFCICTVFLFLLHLHFY